MKEKLVATESAIRHEDKDHIVKVFFDGHLPAGLDLSLHVEFQDSRPVFVKVYWAVPPDALAFPHEVRTTLAGQRCTPALIDLVIADLETLLRRESVLGPREIDI